MIPSIQSSKHLNKKYGVIIFAYTFLFYGCFTFDNVDRSYTSSTEIFDRKGIVQYEPTQEETPALNPIDEVILEVEPTFRRTFGLINNLQEGAILSLIILEISPNEVFRMHLCGEGCNTATSIEVWDEGDINKKIIIVIPETGDYYFWLERFVEPGDSEADTIATAEQVSSRFLVTFDSGAVIVISLISY